MYIIDSMKTNYIRLIFALENGGNLLASFTSNVQTFLRRQ